MILIDGAFGEGGGQILRSSLTLSVITGKPVAIQNIRANRRKPGLQPQHLKSVEAAASISNARLTGNQLSSTELTFEPSRIHSGEYRFDIGTAGSTSLVLQTVFLPLSLAADSSKVTITGGTHVPWSPSFHYLELQWLPKMQRLGFDAELKMEEAGFYPKGGGKIVAEIHPAENISGLVRLDRGELKKLFGISAYANLKRQVAERQLNQAKEILANRGFEPIIEIRKLSSPGINTMMLILGVFEHSLCCYFSLGARGKPAEKVATEAANQFLAFMNTSGVFDEYLADQILLPLALTNQTSEFRVPKITQHLLTNSEVIRQFTEASITIDGELGEEGLVKVVGQMRT
ncbi:RNA 3'-phosphate cyclase [candidate division KSB1 bacterium]|nr:RNA 3'-phosphate cyclase [candidate division KSB1 bacterium]NIR71443.1 RNA 3'-phosphate cyclase [candidate division KSB1 bacterium]NIS23364.1 RNA 3'-phosphate cyclase [candidate division KSB1 bacterium]NIT70255.1 RNA 3'-phosphate cyclase [candidate division KSB1 bacterium]NIU23978.1 RNA 3'-phosphate cyclase [candidate division KSB1 bacterium]